MTISARIDHHANLAAQEIQDTIRLSTGRSWQRIIREHMMSLALEIVLPESGAVNGKAQHPKRRKVKR